MTRASRVLLTGLMVSLTLSTSACGRRLVAPPPSAVPLSPVTPPLSPTPEPEQPAPTAAPTADPTTAPTAGPPAPGPSATPVTPVPSATAPAPAPTNTPPPEPPPPGPPVQPASDIDFWTMVAKMGFTLPKEDMRQQIIDGTKRIPSGWSPGTAGSVATNLANKFADNQKYFVDPPGTADEYAQRGMAFATKQDANTSYYIDLRYSLKGGGGKVLVLKFDQATFEVLGTNASGKIYWYTQWKGTLKLPSYLYVPPSVYQAPGAAGVSAASYRSR